MGKIVRSTSGENKQRKEVNRRKATEEIEKNQMKQIWKGQNLTSIEVRSLRRTVAWTKLKKHEREESKVQQLWQGEVIRSRYGS